MLTDKNLEKRLIQDGKISARQVDQARKQSSETGVSLEETLLQLGYISETELITVRGKLLGVHVIDLSVFPIAEDAATAIPESLAREYNLIPVLKAQNKLTVAMVDPLDVETIENIERLSGCRIEPMLGSKKGIQQAIETYYGVFGKIKALFSEAGRDHQEFEQNLINKKGLEVAQIEGPIAQIIHLIIIQAVNTGASDIHLEPLEQRLRIRFRVDGVLQEVFSVEKIHQAALTSSAKIMCSMDIAEKRIPQDGRFRILVHDRNIDLRASTFPAMHGEKFVIRILDKESANVELTQLGIGGEQFKKLKEVIHQPHGIFLVTGPTGSGKTTTLYSVLKEVNTPLVNVITMEDPVEFDLDTVNQGQVNVKAGLTFAKGLRAIMRQDPDIVMIGEIRDSETAEIATQAALTGHLVLSTLHTNSAPGAIARLTEMGVEPFLVASSLAGALAQRLVRRLCANCKKSYTPPTEVLDHFELDKEIKYTFFKAVGCRECGRVGYKGRAGIYEFMSATDEVRSMIVAGSSTSDLRKQAIKDGMLTLQMDGIQKVISGVTSIEEVMRVAGGDE